MSTATTLTGIMLLGIIFTLGMYVYRSAIIGLAMQIVMGLIGLFESPFMKLFIFREVKPFDEKTKDDLLLEDQVEGKTKTTEDLLLDTWDIGTNAGVTPLLKELSTNNVNYATKRNQWTPLMILSELGSKERIIKCKRLGIDLIVVDAEGWNALHCFMRV